MKKIAILLSVLFISISVLAQTELGDIVYPANGDTPITNCEIIEIQNGNLVVYMKDGKKFQKSAIAIKQDGEYVNLKSLMEKKIEKEVSNENYFQEHSIEQLQKNQLKAKKMKETGIAVTFIGIGAIAVGGVMVMSAGFNQETNTYSNVKGARFGLLLQFGGLLVTATGVPTWITGVKRYNRIETEIQQLKSNQVSLNLGITNNGAGLVLKF